MRTRLRRAPWAVGKRLAVILVLGACVGEDRVAAPTLPPAPPAVASMTVGPLGEPFSLPATRSSNFPTPPTRTPIAIPAGVTARVTVSGYLLFQPNGAYFDCPERREPFVPTPNPVGPAGLDNPERVRAYGVEVGLGDATNAPTSAISLGPLDAAAEEMSGLVQGPGLLWAGRPQVIFVPPPCFGDVPPYFVSGSQRIAVEVEAQPISISAKVETFTPPNSFTAKPAEQTIKLHATVTPTQLAGRVEWRVERHPDHQPQTPLPAGPLRGAEASFPVPPLRPDRWPTDHQASLALMPKQLGYRITATVRDDQGQVHESNREEAVQDEIDTAREEYIELRVGDPPSHGVFIPSARCDNGCVNTGDYTVAVLNADLAAKLAVLRVAFQVLQSLGAFPGGPFQINDIYRNPVHNLLHRVEGAARNSPHQYGCAADLQTFPVRLQDAQGHRFFATVQDSLLALDYWNKLAAMARSIDLGVEDIRRSRIGHVHVGLKRCGRWRHCQALGCASGGGST